MTKASGKVIPVAFIAQEAILGGQLFEHLQTHGAIPEKIARHYFLQILDGLSHIHEKGLCHLDLKPENILLDKSYDAKIVDFGFTTELQEEVGLTQIFGTEGYMAPEIHSRQAYNGQSVDVFALGVVLFQMLTGTPPFMRAMDEDLFYRQIKEKSDLFWKVHQKDNGPYNIDFKSLFSSMVAFDP